MILNKRENCVFCDKTLDYHYTLHKTPISFASTVTPSPGIDRVDLRVGICSECVSLQLIDLIKPEILYKDSHNETFNTPTWMKHHELFFNFCKNFLQKRRRKGFLKSIFCSQKKKWNNKLKMS